MQKIQIIGLAGLNGSGKGSAAKHYLKEYGFKPYNTRDHIIEHLTKDHLPFDRPHMLMKANELREKHGPHYFAEYFIHKANKEKVGCFTIDSIRNPEEVLFIKNNGGIILHIEASTKIRFERIQKSMSTTDSITYEEFLEQERIEMKSDNPNHQNMEQVFLLADLKVDNNHYVGLLKFGLDGIFKNEEVEEEGSE